eukprot:2902058-Prymnesium_polylepis.2
MAGGACGAGSVRGASVCRLCCNPDAIEIASAHHCVPQRASNDTILSLSGACICIPMKESYL